MSPPSADAPADPSAEIERQTDAYFLRTREIVGRFGDKNATYVVFLRRPIVFTPRLALDWLERTARARGVEVKIDLLHQEGAWVGAGQPLFAYSGSLYHLVDLE